MCVFPYRCLSLLATLPTIQWKATLFTLRKQCGKQTVLPEVYLKEGLKVEGFKESYKYLSYTDVYSVNFVNVEEYTYVYCDYSQNGSYLYCHSHFKAASIKFGLIWSNIYPLL